MVGIGWHLEMPPLQSSDPYEDQILKVHQLFSKSFYRLNTPAPRKFVRRLQYHNKHFPQTHTIQSIYPHPSLSQGSNPKILKT